MVLYTPTISRLAEVAERHNLQLTEDELSELRELGIGALRSCERLQAAQGCTLPTRYPRTSGWQPSADENRLNAWAYRCDVAGADGGVLSGKTVALKDIIPVSGVPMSAGSALLQGHVPDFDATVVTRVLDAGGRIVGVAATEDLCLSGASVSAVTGQVRNPRDPARSAGGSSSGVAALVGSGSCDVGIGADQGGSIRIPASLSGVFGMKPTYGLIPYTGCIPIDVSVDYLGPMAGNVEDLAALLQAVAGYDEGLDPRQRSDFEPPSYVDAIRDTDVAGLRIGLVQQGFGLEGLSDPMVDDAVRAAATSFEELGAEVSEVDVLEHQYSMDIHASVLLQGASEFMVRGNGIGLPGKGFYDVALAEATARGRALQASQLFASVKYAMVIGGYLWETYGGAYYAKAQNLAVALRRAYDAVLREYDLLVMPTTAVQAPKLPETSVPGLDAVALALDPALISNTCAFNHTGHPALSVPIGPENDLPVGLMMIGRWYDEATVLRAARALESSGHTLSLPQ
jgi:amidase